MFNSTKRGKIDTFVINPKCVTLGELFGETNPSTMEWSDGLLSSAVRSFAKLAVRKPKKKDTSTCRNSEMPDLYTLNTVNISDAVLTDETLQSTENINYESITDWQWIILDGPVDPIWIENLNSVLDDTRMLCLANSERIYLSPGIRMIFEVDSLSQASPATVSRCAMVYVDPTDLGWKPYVKTWLDGFSKRIAQNDIEYLESSKRRQSTVSFSTEIQNNASPFSNKATSLSGIVPSIMKKKREEEHEGETLIGINTSHDDLANVTRDFNYLVHNIFERKPPAKTSDLSDSDNKMTENQEKRTGTSTFVPNIDTIRHSFLTSLLLLNKHPVLIIGDPGSGKTDMIDLLKNFSGFRSDTFRSPRKTPQSSTKDFFSALNLISAREESDLQGPSLESTRSTIISTLQLGAHTSAAQTKAWILQKLILKSKDILGAPHSKQVLLFIDDLNMPVAEEYGAQPPLELIRQFLDLRGFYDTRHLEWKVRLGTYFYNNRFMVEVQKCKDYLTCSSIALYYRMFHKMRPTPAKCHYTFNLRDLFRVLEGLLQAHRSVIVSKETTALFFVHESTRVFHDRLIDSAEKEIFYNFLSNEINNYFK
ncbi:hypothetical protein JD844_025155, partial [Phrynosoma platyrhinos]